MDSNPHTTDSNIDSNKFAWTTWIRISIGWIRIPNDKVEESKAMNSNSCKKKSIPLEELWKTSEREWSRIRIPYTTIRIHESKNVMNTWRIRILARWIRISFTEWSWKLKDSNLRVLDSNPLLVLYSNFAKEIWILE